MSGKQSAKPRFGGVFFCPRKSQAVAGGAFITSSSRVRSNATVACWRCTSRHTNPTFSGTLGSLKGFHSSALLLCSSWDRPGSTVAKRV